VDSANHPNDDLAAITVARRQHVSNATLNATGGDFSQINATDRPTLLALPHSILGARFKSKESGSLMSNATLNATGGDFFQIKRD
jgi:hypothetical protein